MRIDLVEQNTDRNRETAGLSDSYASHREMVMKLIAATVADLSGKPDGNCSSAVLLGAGNCHDVDLVELSKLFQTMHLVDLDQLAIDAAIAASGISSENCRTHAPVDIAEPLLSLTSRDFEPKAENSEKVINLLQLLAAENAMAEIPEADIVVSLCVFSQILDSVQLLMNSEHPSFGHVIKSLRIGHLHRMLSMLRPGGVAVFVTDIVSSDTAPELKTVSDQDLPDTVKQLVNDRNFFSGTNPASMLVDLNMLSRLPQGPDTVHTIDPWLWQIGEKTFAVYALRIQKKLPAEQEDAAESE